ncbi:hypothetical protein DXG03_004420 [Asterophora parasitica]|uniref:Uncharacterized protein n=1 Tax=Asterophora parasitica TaxID=117018 RepID=A0A9P7G068_9AGAR|nr:hypothetical protein DXG03_004420 [Asterophora parasitica]
MGISYPDKVLSLYLISPPALEEPREVTEGRQEIYDLWVHGWRNYPDLDEAAFKDVLTGGHQLAYNNVCTTFNDALTEFTIPLDMRNYNRDRFEEFHTTSVKFFADHAPHSLEQLRRLKSPVQLVQCGGDVAYPIALAQRLLYLMLSAGVDAELDVVDGAPHFGTVTHFKEFNPRIHDFIISHTTEDVPPVPNAATSPFDLVSLDWTPETDEITYVDLEDWQREYSFDFRAALDWAYPPHKCNTQAPK